jgi:hypothetical protein
LVTQCRLRISWEHFGGSFWAAKGKLVAHELLKFHRPEFPSYTKAVRKIKGLCRWFIYIEPSNYITYPKDRRYSATIFVPHLLCVWFSERRFKKNHIEDGGFHKLNGGTPKWMVYNGKSF